MSLRLPRGAFWVGERRWPAASGLLILLVGAPVAGSMASWPTGIATQSDATRSDEGEDRTGAAPPSSIMAGDSAPGGPYRFLGRSEMLCIDA